MRVVFLGTPDFAVPSLAALIGAGIDVAAVVTQPDRPRGRSHSTLVAPPVKQCALAAGIPVRQPERPRDPSFDDDVRSLGVDLGVVVAYGHLLRPPLLAIPRFGFVNVHASLLPRWRGAAPIQWALLSGDAETGVTIMRVEAGLDTGAVWHSCRTAIVERDTAATLTERLSQLGAAALIEALPRIAGGAMPTPQGDAGATHAPKLTRDLARIRWEESAAAVCWRIRAMDPAPGAWTTLNGAEVKLYGVSRRPHEVPAHHLAPVPGGIAASGATVVATTGDGGTVEIREIQLAGRRRMPAAEWLHGANLPAGARFA